MSAADCAHDYTFRVTATDNVGNAGQGEASTITPNAVTKYYYSGGQRVAVRKLDGAVNWLHGDHPSKAEGSNSFKGSRTSTQRKGIVDDVLTTTIPDYLDDAARVMGEIKDVAKLSGTKQIRAQLEYAGRENYRYILHVRKDTKVVQWLWDFADDNDWFEIVTDVVSATE